MASSSPSTPGNNRPIGVHQDQGGQFAAGQHKIADGDDVGGQVLADAFVEGFIAPADEGQLVVGGELTRHRLVETLALRAEQDHRAGSGETPSTASTAAKIGSGFITMPPPPP